MFRIIFEFFSEPLGLPIAWYWEYAILAVIGMFAYIIAYNTVGDMYKSDFISGSGTGSFFHWVIRLFVFVIIWAVTYGVIWLGKLVISNWQMILIVLSVLVGVIGLCALAILGMQKSRAARR